MAAARQGTPQRGSGGWPPDIKPCLCVTMKSVLNAKPPLTASAYSASLRLCVKHLYTFYMFYTAKNLLSSFSVFRGSILCVLCSSALNTIANTIGSDLVVKVTLSVFLAHAW